MAPIALTGGVASGKSTLLAHAQSLGVAVASADDASTEIWNDPQTRADIAAALDLPGEPSRDEVRAKIAREPEARRRLNDLMHPRILRALLASGAQIVEVPLLVEACAFAPFREVWVVSCSPETQLERLTRRIGDERKARELMAAQVSSAVREAFADRVLRTNGSLRLVQGKLELALTESGLV